MKAKDVLAKVGVPVAAMGMVTMLFGASRVNELLESELELTIDAVDGRVILMADGREAVNMTFVELMAYVNEPATDGASV